MMSGNAESEASERFDSDIRALMNLERREFRRYELARAAMEALISSDGNSKEAIASIVQEAAKFADAMLAELEKKG